MLRINLDRATIELLHNLSEPLELCDEAGWLLGTFMPEAHEPIEAPVAAEWRPEHHENLGEEMSVYGFETDIE